MDFTREYAVKTERPIVPKDDLRIILLSDTHELHRDVDVPNGDLLIHSGDFTMFSRSQRSLIDFKDWLGELPHRWKLVISGNHETILESPPGNRQLLTNATLLINEGVELAGLHVWGSPVTHGSGPAFKMPSADDRRRLYAQIPGDTDILVTHGPPFGILDRVPGSDVHAGDPVLLEAVLRLKPMLHVFGHVHGAHGMHQSEHTLFVNAALLGPDGGIAHQPVVLKLPRK